MHTSKVNDYMPTPMQLDCFCEHCQASPESPLHSYKLYAIIMHLGATMASGHYVAYTRVCPSTADYAACSRSKTASAASSAGYSSNRSNSERNSNHSSGTGGILRFFKPKSSSSLGTETQNSTGNASPVMMCRYFSFIFINVIIWVFRFFYFFNFYWNPLIFSLSFYSAY